MKGPGRGLVSVMLALILTAALAGCSSSSGGTMRSASEKAAAARRKGNPYYNFQSPYSDVDQQNTRHARSSIEAANVADLEQVWSRPIEGTGESDERLGFSVVSDDVVYLQDLSSNVAALDLGDGEAIWEKRYDVPPPRPGGVSLSRGFFMAYGATPTKAFALDEKTGKETWSVQLAGSRSGTEIGMLPAYFNGRVYVTTRPNGTLWALDCRDGRKAWHVRVGGGVSEPPAFDEGPSVYLGAGGSVVKVDEVTDKVAWRYRVTPRPISGRDVGGPVVKDFHGREMVIAGSRSGFVVALDRETGKPLWRHPVGTRGGGVSGPLSIRRSTVFVPIADGELTALDLATGAVEWKRELPASLSGPTTTTTNDLVFAGSRDGVLSAFQADTGREVWSEELSGAIEGMTLGGETLLVQSGPPGAGEPPQLLAYRLGG